MTSASTPPDWLVTWAKVKRNDCSIQHAQLLWSAAYQCLKRNREPQSTLYILHKTGFPVLDDRSLNAILKLAVEESLLHSLSGSPIKFAFGEADEEEEEEEKKDKKKKQGTKRKEVPKSLKEVLREQDEKMHAVLDSMHNDRDEKEMERKAKEFEKKYDKNEEDSDEEEVPPKKKARAASPKTKAKPKAKAKAKSKAKGEKKKKSKFDLSESKTILDFMKHVEPDVNGFLDAGGDDGGGEGVWHCQLDLAINCCDPSLKEDFEALKEHAESEDDYGNDDD